MSIQTFIEAIPKVELHVHLEGSMRPEVITMIAEQNDVPYTIKNYEEWIDLLNHPDPSRIDELIREVSQWIQQPEDISRLVYDLGVQLSKQNIRYAEVSINPALYMQDGMTFEQFVEALVDGRDRVLRGWNVDMGWILTIPRSEPRRSDEIARWASGATARKSNIVGIGLSGREDVQPIGQFERAFRTAEKKGVPRVVHASDNKTDEIAELVEMLTPQRIMDGWGIADAPELMGLLVEQGIALDLSPTRILRLGLLESYEDLPLRRLYDEGVIVAIGTDMPALFNTTLSEEYQAVVDHCDVNLEELQEIALNAVRSSALPEESKAAMLETFKQEYQQLYQEHVALVETPEE